MLFRYLPRRLIISSDRACAALGPLLQSMPRARSPGQRRVGAARAVLAFAQPDARSRVSIGPIHRGLCTQDVAM
eukprot:15450054-Alexandrium_andersonii.AAC.1